MLICSDQGTLVNKEIKVRSGSSFLNIESPSCIIICSQTPVEVAFSIFRKVAEFSSGKVVIPYMTEEIIKWSSNELTVFRNKNYYRIYYRPSINIFFNISFNSKSEEKVLEFRDWLRKIV